MWRKGEKEKRESVEGKKTERELGGTEKKKKRNAANNRKGG